ncbi:MAG: UbiA prenyltransferase family protein [Rickettsiales bacterium]
MMPATLRLLRPKQWIKNLFVFAPLFFAGQFKDAGAWQLTIYAALCFLFVSCVVYVCNDIKDIEEDRLHPVKCKRPLAAGEILSFQAILLACILAAAAMFVATLLPPACAVVAVIYVLLNLLYTFVLKRFALIDVFFIATCYVLRVLMGCYALGVIISPWIILTTFLLALFLGFGKRYHEMGFEEYVRKKPNLQHYNRQLLDRLVNISSGAALITYAIYTAEVAEKTGKVELVYTIAFVAFGLFRYLQAIYVYDQGGEPETVILKDKLQLLNIALWLAVTLWIMF